MTTLSPTATATMPGTTNAPAMNDIIAACTELGTQAGKGVDVQIKFDLKLLEAAFLGTLSLDPDKHGSGVDDATKLSEAYWTARQGAVVFNAKDGNQRKTISNSRKCIKMGSCPKWGNGEPMGAVNTLMTVWQGLRKDPSSVKKLDDAHNTLMRYCTMQLKMDTIMDEAQLRTFCFKTPTDVRTGVEVLEDIRKIANKLKVGKVSNCPDLDNSPEVQAIINACTKRLVVIAKARGDAPATRVGA